MESMEHSLDPPLTYSRESTSNRKLVLPDLEISHCNTLNRHFLQFIAIVCLFILACCQSACVYGGGGGGSQGGGE